MDIFDTHIFPQNYLKNTPPAQQVINQSMQANQSSFWFWVVLILFLGVCSSCRVREGQNKQQQHLPPPRPGVDLLRIGE